jgi:hypothetical protein
LGLIDARAGMLSYLALIMTAIWRQIRAVVDGGALRS